MHPNLVLRRLAASTQPSEAEVNAATSHFRTIRSRLNASFGLPRIFQIGSHARGTAIRHHSDIDFLAVLPKKRAYRGDRLITPQAFLMKVADDLKDRYTATSVRRDGQAIVMQFRGGAHAVDLVPGIFEDMHGSRPLYLIPGSANDWIPTSPETHDRIFRAADDRSGGKLGAVARLIKAWKFGREPPIPLTSFYTDLLLATSDVAMGVQSYGECLYKFFQQIAQRSARGLQDPAHISGIISANGSAAARARLIDAAKYAMEHAGTALYAQQCEKPNEAVRQWGIVFNRSL